MERKNLRQDSGHFVRWPRMLGQARSPVTQAEGGADGPARRDMNMCQVVAAVLPNTTMEAHTQAARTGALADIVVYRISAEKGLTNHRNTGAPT